MSSTGGATLERFLLRRVTPARLSQTAAEAWHPVSHFSSFRVPPGAMSGSYEYKPPRKLSTNLYEISRNCTLSSISHEPNQPLFLPEIPRQRRVRNSCENKNSALRQYPVTMNHNNRRFLSLSKDRLPRQTRSPFDKLRMALKFSSFNSGRRPACSSCENRHSALSGQPLAAGGARDYRREVGSPRLQLSGSLP